MITLLYVLSIAVLCHLNFAVSIPSTMRPTTQWPRQLRPRLAWFLGTIVLVGLSGCGPGVPDHASNPESRASLGISSESKSVSQNTPATGPVPFAAAFASNSAPASAAQEESASLPEYLDMPTWIAQALDAPEVSVRLEALDTWAQQGAQAPLDPLIVALDDENDAVREKAMMIIEQNWVID